MDLKTVFKCVMLKSADTKLFFSLALCCKRGAQAAREIRDLASLNFVVTEETHHGWQTYLSGSQLLHGTLGRRNGNGTTEISNFRFGKLIARELVQAQVHILDSWP